MDGKAAHSEIVLGHHCGIQFFARHRIMHAPDQLILGCVRGIHSLRKLILWTYFWTWQGASGWMQNPFGDQQAVHVILQGHPNAMSDKVVGKGFDDDAISTPLKGSDKRLLMRVIGEWEDGHSVDCDELCPPCDRRAEEPQGGNVSLPSIHRAHGDICGRTMAVSKVGDTHQREHGDDDDS